METPDRGKLIGEIGAIMIAAAQISSIMSGAQFDTVFNSPMQLEHRGNKMALETKAAASALFGNMQDTGDIDMDLLDAWNRAGMAELAATGMSIPDQIAAQVFEQYKIYQRSQRLLNAVALLKFPRWLPVFSDAIHVALRARSGA